MEHSTLTDSLCHQLFHDVSLLSKVLAIFFNTPSQQTWNNAHMIELHQLCHTVVQISISRYVCKTIYIPVSVIHWILEQPKSLCFNTLDVVPLERCIPLHVSIFISPKTFDILEIFCNIPNTYYLYSLHVNSSFFSVYLGAVYYRQQLSLVARSCASEMTA